MMEARYTVEDHAYARLRGTTPERLDAECVAHPLTLHGMAGRIDNDRISGCGQRGPNVRVTRNPDNVKCPACQRDSSPGGAIMQRAERLRAHGLFDGRISY